MVPEKMPTVGLEGLIAFLVSASSSSESTSSAPFKSTLVNSSLWLRDGRTAAQPTFQPRSLPTFSRSRRWIARRCALVPANSNWPFFTGGVLVSCLDDVRSWYFPFSYTTCPPPALAYGGSLELERPPPRDVERFGCIMDLGSGTLIRCSLLRPRIERLFSEDPEEALLEDFVNGRDAVDVSLSTWSRAAKVHDLTILSIR
jgi:hypothetical protein